MKSPLIAPFAIVSLLFAACEQKSAQITSSAPPPSPAPTEAAETPDSFAVSPSFSAEASPTAEAAVSPSTTGTSNPRPVFRNEAANQAVNQYLDTYDTLRNDVTAAPGTRPAIPTDPRAAIEAAKTLAQKVGRDTQELANQKKQVNRLLTPDEKKRFREYQKSLEQAGRNTDQNQ